MSQFALGITVALFLITLMGCKNQSYYTDSYRYIPRTGDITVFDSSPTDYREQHGFDVFRDYGSFRNGRFY
jgi:hypothetical protein